MKRTLLLLGLASCASQKPADHAADTVATRPPLAYKGWALGISYDSASALTAAQTGEGLGCLSDGTGYEYRTCSAGADSVSGVTAGFLTATGELAFINVRKPLIASVTDDSIRVWFEQQWGARASPYIPTGFDSASDVPHLTRIGEWVRADTLLSAYDEHQKRRRVLWVVIEKRPDLLPKTIPPAPTSPDAYKP